MATGVPVEARCAAGRSRPERRGGHGSGDEEVLGRGGWWCGGVGGGAAGRCRHPSASAEGTSRGWRGGRHGRPAAKKKVGRRGSGRAARSGVVDPEKKKKKKQAEERREALVLARRRRRPRQRRR